VQVGLAAGLQAVPRVVLRDERPGLQVGQPALLALADRAEDLLLAGEVVVQRALRHGGGGGDLVQGRGPVALTGEEVARGGEQLGGRGVRALLLGPSRPGLRARHRGAI
jgi:hypothetical protein